MWCVSFIIIIISFFLIFLPFFSGSRKVDLFESNDATSFRLKLRSSYVRSKESWTSSTVISF